jgi:hypothetical protein
MALAVGEDLSPAELQELRLHVEVCSKCLPTWERHQCGFAVLQHSRTHEPRPNRDSVWPTLANRLREREAANQRREFNGWFAALAVTAACILVFAFSQETSMTTASRSQSGVPQSDRLVISPDDPRESPPTQLWRDGFRNQRPYNADPQPVPRRP